MRRFFRYLAYVQVPKNRVPLADGVLLVVPDSAEKDMRFGDLGSCLAQYKRNHVSTR